MQKHKICNKAVTLETKQQRAAKLDAGQQYSSYEILKQSEVPPASSLRTANNKVAYNFSRVCPKQQEICSELLYEKKV